MKKLQFTQSKYQSTQWECIISKTYSCTIEFFDCGKKYRGWLKTKLPSGCYTDEYGSNSDYLVEDVRVEGFDTPLEAALALEQLIETKVKELKSQILELT